MSLILTRRLIALIVVAVVSACGGNKPAPATGSTGEQKGVYGVSYYVSVSRPVGGTITSEDGRIDCGTAGGTKNLCDPISFAWGATATFTATPDTGQFFQSWAGDCSGAVASGVGGCSLNTLTYGSDKWVVAVFNPPDQLGHSRIPNPSQHSPLFFDFIKSKATPNPGAPKCTNCHGANYTGLANAPSCTACHAAAGFPNWLTDCNFCHRAPPATGGHASVPPGDVTACNECHPDTVLANGTINAASGAHMNGKMDGGCGGCHALPPPTGAHVAHFGLTAAELTGAEGSTGHGDLGTLQTRFPPTSVIPAPAKYAFGCGNCHPMDDSLHNNGTKDVVLTRPGVAGSLKELNDPNAGYNSTSKTCSGVYCHSRLEFSAPFVPDPILGTGPGFYPITYPPYDVFVTRVYTNPTWDGATLTCNACHGMPPQSSDPANAGGAGDSHSWVNPFGVADLHGYAMGTGPIACATCHFDTVTLQGVRSLTGWQDFPVYEDLPIASFASHVNGRPDVRFTDENILMGSTPFTANPTPALPPAPAVLAPGWESGTKTCTNVSCHLQQTEVKWGRPYRYWTEECNVCHAY